MSTDRPILTGFMAIEEWADDYSDWSGAITGPADPTGANRFWENPIPMIEKRAYDSLKSQLAELQAELQTFRSNPMHKLLSEQKTEIERLKKELHATQQGRLDSHQAEIATLRATLTTTIKERDAASDRALNAFNRAKAAEKNLAVSELARGRAVEALKAYTICRHVGIGCAADCGDRAKKGLASQPPNSVRETLEELEARMDFLSEELCACVRQAGRDVPLKTCTHCDLWAKLRQLLGRDGG